MDKTYRPYIAELIGTFALVFISAGAVITGYLISGTSGAGGQLTTGAIIGIALAQGLILAVALAITVPLSGGYLNPAITLMLYVFKRFDLGKTLGLIFTQVVGAVLAGGLLRVLLGMNENLLVASQLGTPHVNPSAFGADYMSAGMKFSGVGLELIGTFILAAAVFASFYDPRVPHKLGRIGTWLSPLWIGLVKVVCVLVLLVWTGAALNPARYFGTAIWEETVPALGQHELFADHMVYWIGPILGALLAGGAYIYLILPEEEEAPAPPAVTTAKRSTPGATLSRTK
ncbi:MAG TPA: aquaporin [Gemmataceae bacterium]|nr:aquaporin [Gemmataceae bacterium]